MMSKQPTATIVASSTAGNLVCAAAGRISTTQGTALEILERSKEKQNNAGLIEKVVASGHRSILEHAMFTIAFDHVSVCTEEFVIEFRLASYTVQSRRYVDFSNAGFYLPPLPEHLQERFSAHMQSLFADYDALTAAGIPKEDARFLLPYCFHSNFYCTLNARELMHMIAAMRWGRGSVFPELKQLGESLSEQFSAYFPNLMDSMRPSVLNMRYALPKCCPPIAEPTVCTARTEVISAPQNFDSIWFEAASANGMIVPSVELSIQDIVAGERLRELELMQAVFRIRNLSLAAVTHLVRHRMQTVLVPQVTRAMLDNHYVLPQTIQDCPSALKCYTSAFHRNTDCLRELLADGLPMEAVQYFALAGNQLDVMCAMNGRELQHFFALRTCRRAQWEIRAVALELLQTLAMVNPAMRQFGPSCYTKGICPEGRLSCGQAAAVKTEFDTLFSAKEQ